MAREPISERNLDGYDAPMIPWAMVQARLAEGFTQAPGTGGPDRHTCWVATVRPDGRPHVAGVGVLFVDDRFYFNAGAGTRKAKNLAADPRCVITVATQPFDLVIEGDATMLREPDAVDRIARAFVAQGWPARVTPDGSQLTADYSAPSAGPPPWDVYEVTPNQVFALATSEPGGATVWRF